jgi:hypothetical protein
MKVTSWTAAVGALVLFNGGEPSSLLSQDAAGAGVKSSQGEVREWTDLTGRKIRASLAGFSDADTLLLRMEDGRSVPYPIAKLSPADATFARGVMPQNKSNANASIDWNSPKESDLYVIRGISRENAPGYVSTQTGWEYRGKCIEAKVQFKGSSGVSSGNVKAYFYDREGKLLEKVDKPPRRQDENQNYVKLPEFFKKGETFEVYFPLTPFLEESKWSTVLITFGTGEDFAVKTMPGSNYEGLDFDEKKYVFPGYTGSDTPATTGSETPLNVELEIRRLRQGTNDLSMVFDGDYNRGRPCITAEVRAKGEIKPGEGSVKLYVFDDSGRMVDSRERPSTSEVKDGTYLGRPNIADDQWHPVFFALDGKLKEKKYSTFVLVFEYGGRIGAVVESAVGATLEKLDFPEKTELAPN